MKCQIKKTSILDNSFFFAFDPGSLSTLSPQKLLATFALCIRGATAERTAFDLYDKFKNWNFNFKDAFSSVCPIDFVKEQLNYI